MTKRAVKNVAPKKSAPNKVTPKKAPLTKGASKASSKSTAKRAAPKDSRKRTNQKPPSAQQASKQVETKVIPQPEPAAIAPAVAPLPEEAKPARAPTRKIIGAGGPILVRPVLEPAAATTTAAPALQAMEPTVEQVKVEPPAKVGWGQLPKHVPARLRFLIESARLECDRAKNWPFPFAKFLVTLPSRIGGLDFALLMLDCEHELPSLAKACGIAPEFAAAALERGREELIDQFLAICPEMARKFGSHLPALTIAAETLIEPYLVPNLSRDFQIAIGTTVLAAFGMSKISLRDRQYAA